ncbi:hypothetical protein RhiJN_24318 [Ceratobasidium sp. AG-Ba]|nr:hypothetical protein RhiJN_24318 [Ceratobasidium sp. AG-Ba]
MPHAVLPNISRPKPKIKATTDASDTAEPIKWSALKMEDPDDEPGAEMEKEARVWRTYVKETERWDKEMVDGRNNSLDVLLSANQPSTVFAALFSAVSTAFITQSLGDLKPDPAVLSAQTLLVISQKLDLITNGQRTTFPTDASPVDHSFSPPYSAVVVNVLWLLSLSLSIAVSLIAMLAKEWCYNFISGRSGQAYDQARRRQQRWNGIARWKMQEILSYLPGLMHLALLLFSIGLCTYLWNLNVSVAAPVTLVSWMATCVYVFATFLPLTDRYCPFGTPVTPVAQYVRPILTGFRHLLFSIVVNFSWKTSYPKWLGPQNADEKTEKPKEFEPAVPMDIVTSQMLAWMIVNCEDSRSVDLALQAIAGARHELPQTTLADARALELIDTRLRASTRWDRCTGRFQPKHPGLARAILRYGRSYTVLITGDGYKCGNDSWRDWYSSTNERRWTSGRNLDEIANIQISLFGFVELENEDLSALAAAAAGPIALSRWEWNKWYLPDDAIALSISLNQVLKRVAHMLGRRANRNDVLISDRALICLMESCAHYMIGRWPKLQNQRKCRLSAALVCLFVKSRDAAPEISRIIATSLAAATFALSQYPSGGQSPEHDDDRERRAVHVLEHYRTKRLHLDQIDELFTFGLVGLLPYLNLPSIDPPASIMDELRNITCKKITQTYVYSIQTLPELYSWSTHWRLSYQRFLHLVSKSSDPTDGYSEQISLYVWLLPDDHKYMLCIPSIVSMRHTRSKNLQDACITFLRSLPAACCDLDADALFGSQDMVLALFQDSTDTDVLIEFAVAFYFRLLVATVMLNPERSFSSRQSTLQRLIDSCADFQTTKPTNYLPPTEDMIIAHLAEEIRGRPLLQSMSSTMQLVVDFCYASRVKHINRIVPGDRSFSIHWAMKLREIKDAFESCAFSNTHPSHTSLFDTKNLC